MRTWKNSHAEALDFLKNLCSGKNQKQKKTLGKKEKKKKERVPFCQEKEKHPWWKRPVLAELHTDAQISNEVASKQSFSYTELTTRFPFI